MGVWNLFWFHIVKFTNLIMIQNILSVGLAQSCSRLLFALELKTQYLVLYYVTASHSVGKVFLIS